MGNDWNWDGRIWADLGSGPGFDGYGPGRVRVTEPKDVTVPKPKGDKWPVLRSAQEVEADTWNLVQRPTR